MSGNGGVCTPDAVDRRTARTRQSILNAFIELMFERRYDGFAVPDIVTRANIGRSTFYEHFGGKDALLRVSMEGMLTVLADAGAGSAANPEALRGVIDHFWENRRLGRTVFAPPLRALIERQLAELIEARLPAGSRLPALQIAAAQLSAVDAWVTGATSATPDEVAGAVAATARLAR